MIAIGCYTADTNGSGKGVTLVRAQDDGLVVLGEHPLASPSWVQWHPSRPVLYAVQEVAEGALTALAVADDGTVTELGTLPTGGADPCHFAITADHRHLLVANYTGGNVAVFALDERGGLIERTDLVAHEGSGPNAERQEGPHPHQIVLDGDRVLVVDLGTDEIRGYTLTESGTLTPTTRTHLPAGTGPRQFVRGPHGAYVLAELGAALLALAEPAPGEFTVRATVPASGIEGKNYPAQLTLTEDGTRAYLSNRGPDTVAVFDLTGPAPVLAHEHPVGPGWPRHFALDGTRLYAATQDGDAVTIHDLAADGRLNPVGRFATGTPTCIAVA